MNMNSIRVVALCLAVTACDSRDAPKTPLGQSTSSGTGTGITGEARVALDSGNMLFRGKLYEAALAQYERAAKVAPAETAPLLGIMMVADVKKDERLAEATLVRLKKLDPSLADSDAVSSHAKAMKQHPSTGSSTKLPPQHPPIGGATRPPPATSGSLQ